MTSLLENDFYAAYRTQEDIYEAFTSLEISYPTVASYLTLGSTYEGRDICAIRLTNSASTSPKHQFVIDSGYHGCDWAAISACVYLIKRFIASPLLDYCEIYFIPVVNGYGLAFAQSYDRLYLKNRKNPGVDLQRNFSFHWGEAGGTNTPGSDRYHGAHAASEIETEVMQKFFSTLTNFKGYISLGCYGQLIISPWGWSTEACQDASEQSRVMGLMASAISAGGYTTHYCYGSYSDTLSPQSGTSVDYVYGVHHVIHSYHLRLRDTGRYGYLLPTNQLIPLGEETFAGINAMLMEIA
jgi:hypothetical protein